MLRHSLLGFIATMLMISTAHAQQRAAAVPTFGNIAPIDGFAEQADPDLHYRAVFSITEASSTDEVNRSLEKVARYLNLLASGGVPPEEVSIVAVVHGPATPIVANTSDNPNLSLIAELQDAGVTIAICSQAIHRAQMRADDLAPNVRIDASALTTLTNLQLRGWAVVYD